MKIRSILRTAAVCLLLAACTDEVPTEYQAYMTANPERALMILNGSSDNIAAIDLSTDTVYTNIRLVGYSSTGSAVPSDIIEAGGQLNVLLSGQNSIEGYNLISLDYLNDGKHYFKNGYNPMSFIPVGDTGWVFVAGLETDDIQIVNLDDADDDYSFVGVCSEAEISDDMHQETQVASTDTNAVGDNHDRCPTGGAVFEDGSSSYLFVTNVRYDSGILLTDGGELAEYPADSDNYVSAGGYFREATLSIFSFNADALETGAAESEIDLRLVKEINLEELFSAAWTERSYYPGDGLNPQSAFILDGRLNIICTGTNGGEASSFTSDEFIPDGYNLIAGSVKPGSDPDDGIILVLDISRPEVPSYLTHLEIGGSPSGFRGGMDTGRKIVYLAGVGGVQSYRYGEDAADFEALHPSSDMILTADDPDTDYYSGLCYDETGGTIYISFYSDDEVKSIKVSGSTADPVYTDGSSWQTGDGPGALTIIKRW